MAALEVDPHAPWRNPQRLGGKYESMAPWRQPTRQSRRRRRAPRRCPSPHELALVDHHHVIRHRPTPRQRGSHVDEGGGGHLELSGHELAHERHRAGSGASRSSAPNGSSRMAASFGRRAIARASASRCASSPPENVRGRRCARCLTPTCASKLERLEACVRCRGISFLLVLDVLACGQRGGTARGSGTAAERRRWRTGTFRCFSRDRAHVVSLRGRSRRPWARRRRRVRRGSSTCRHRTGP